jgi:SpoVK/Ycf46/Vps4 family AAA+-type ATPase
MASGKILRQLIKSGATGDLQAFRQASEAVIREERQKQHHLLANDLEKLLYGEYVSASPGLHILTEQLPVDQERGLPLLSLREPARSLEDIVLSNDNQQILEEILEQHHRADVLKSYGMRATDRILFCGPPGCGKTMCAEVLAMEMGLPLALIRLDSVVSSYLGETAANLRKVFDFVNTRPMVVLFDEFDAIGKERTDATEHGELKRVVNAVLQMLDAYQGKSLIIAATNHESMLDSAIWRRFEDVLVFNVPTREELVRLLTIKLRGVRREFEIDSSDVLSLFQDVSHADVERVLRRAIKEMILKGQEFLSLRHLNRAQEKELSRKNKMCGGIGRNVGISTSET